MASRGDPESGTVIGYPKPKEPKERCGICCTFILLVAFLASIVVPFCVYDARSARRHLRANVDPPQLWVMAASLNLSGPPSELSVDFILSLSLHNNNTAVGRDYHNISTHVTFGPRTIVEAAIPPLSQTKGSSTDLSLKLSTARLNPIVARGITEQRAAYRGVVFGLKIWADITPRPAYVEKRSWTADCGEIAVWFDKGNDAVGSTTGKPTHCYSNDPYARKRIFGGD